MANGLFGGGLGTISNPYLVEDALDLKAIYSKLNMHYKLSNNIDLTDYDNGLGQGWDILPFSKNTSFSGSLDGDGFSIINYRVEVREGEAIRSTSLLPQIDGTVKNIIFESPVIRIHSSIVSGSSVNGISFLSSSTGDKATLENIDFNNVLIEAKGIDYCSVVSIFVYGSTAGRVKLNNIHANGKVNGRSELGGLFYRISGFDMTNCSFEGEINGYNEVGGIASLTIGTYSIGFSVKNSFVKADITGYSNVSGFFNSVDVSYNQRATAIAEDCFFEGNVKGYNNVSGFLCRTSTLSAGTLTDTCFNINRCYVKGVITADYSVGGFLMFSANTVIKDCYTDITVLGNQSQSGFIGNGQLSRYMNIDNCYSIVTIKFNTQSSVGTAGVQGNFGFCNFSNQSSGMDSVFINSCYTVTTDLTNIASTKKYAFALRPDSKVNNCYFDSTTQNYTNSNTLEKGIPKTTSEMKSVATFANWDKELWYVANGKYPSLAFGMKKLFLIKCDGKVYTIRNNKLEQISTAQEKESDFLSHGLDSSIISSSLNSSTISQLNDFNSVELLAYFENEGAEKLVIVTETVETYDLYELLDDELELLYYTDSDSLKQVDLILEANYSQIDELDGDFEVVTWTSEPQENAQRVLEMTAIPKPQFVKLASARRLYGQLDSFEIKDISNSYREEARYLFSGLNSDKWYVWDFANRKFSVVDATSNESIHKNGMKYSELQQMTANNWGSWSEEYINIGVFLKDNERNSLTSVVDKISYKSLVPNSTPKVSNTSLYILNTTAKINIEFNGSLLSGFLSDDDLTRVQYRVIINGGSYFPENGQFTKLSESPENIELIIKSDKIKIGEPNTIRVEFQDFFGTTDYWETSFIGTYAGLMFKDVQGQFYSSEAGEVLQYLDFGIIIAGQTTLENEIILKNQYGYDIENIYLYANHDNLPQGMSIQFSESISPFTPKSELPLSRVLKNNEEMSFFIRLKTDLYATPDAIGTFDIVVRADRVE